MADASDSTPAPSRRGFFGSAVGAGIAAAGPPIFTVPAATDAALLAMAPIIAGLIAAADRALAAYNAAEQAAFEMTSPTPIKPRDIQCFPTDAAYRKAMAEWEAACVLACREQKRIEEETGVEALDKASADAERAVISACGRLAEMRATTLEGLILKAKFAERGDSERLPASIVADLLAMV